MSDDRPVVVVVPTDEEFTPYRACLTDLRRLVGCGPWEAYEGRSRGRRVVAILSDCGPTNAGAAAERAIAQFAPVAMLNGGAAGAHDADLLPGDLVLGSSTCVLVAPDEQAHRQACGLHRKGVRFRRAGARVHLDRCEADPRLLAAAERAAREEPACRVPWVGQGWPEGVPRRAPRIVTGIIGSGDSWTRDPQRIAAFRACYGTASEDMESAFLAQVCAMHTLPFLAVRAISDNEAVAPLPVDEVAGALAAAGARAAVVVARVAAAA